MTGGRGRTADYDAGRVKEVVNCGAFGEEFGIGEDFEGGVWSVEFQLAPMSVPNFEN